VPGTVLQRSAAGGDYAGAVGCANCVSPLQPPLFPFKKNFGEVKKCKLFAFHSPKQSILPYKHKGTSVYLAPGA